MANDAPKAPTKTEIYANIAESTGLSKKDIAAVFDALAAEINKNMKRKAAGQFTIPGLCKIVRVEKKALPKRKGRNPATGEEIWLNPKPASTTVKVRPLKALKEMVA
ncbi:MAG: HU family DNA-binding protein [Planctomycetes bacterium]|nr:HU family DNA-binding protein [Planctomycetota bacterium]